MTDENNPDIYIEYSNEAFPPINWTSLLNNAIDFKTKNSGIMKTPELTLTLKNKNGKFTSQPVLLLELDEGTGTIAHDTSDNGNDGSLYNGVAWVDGKYGKALSFDGVDDYVQVPHNASLAPPNITLSCWVKLNAIDRQDRKSVV